MDEQMANIIEGPWEDRTISLAAANVYGLVGLVPIFLLAVLPFWWLVGIEAMG